MLSYLTAFIFYTLAMVGIMFVAVVVYKKMNLTTKIDSKGTIKIIDTCPIGAKKTLLIVQIKNEKFLIASGMEHTTFLAKLDNNIEPLIQEDLLNPKEEQSFNKELIEQELLDKKRTTKALKEQAQKQDPYDYLYKRTQQLEQNNQEYSFENSKNKLNDMYSNNSDLNQKINKAFSKRDLMQEILDDIHQKKVASRGRF